MRFLPNFPTFPARRTRITLLAALFLCASGIQAKAALVFCNRTQQPIEAALGHREHGDDDQGDIWISEGWWRIEPGQCSRVFGQPLTERFYFYHATALAPSSPGKKPFVWQGKYQFCTDAKAFKIEGDGDCEGRGYRVKGFQQIDLGPNTRDYTLDFKDNG
jgi:uncharacterized membrane protein